MKNGATDKPLLSAAGLGHCAAGRKLFSGLDLEARGGDCIAVLGANGSGKSTLLRILAGLIEPDEGSIRRCGDTRLAYLGHKLGLSDELSPVENLEALAALGNAEPLMAATSALQSFNVTSDRACRDLSAGQRQRVALARLLHLPASLWLLDEPQTALDDEGKQLLAELIENHLRRGGAALVCSHDQSALPAATRQVRLGT